ncbi:MAG: type 1 glutamine amidotransferase domain-containing protein [Halopseudomonas sp.]|uniref:type 1 glutamine amidotransferase domain-containing protein n=1 Tax=Halopseudomonas sp. TaxID=2901191 RepID=UPI003002333E
MATSLNGKRIAFLATDGVEQIELTRPWQDLKDAGATVQLVSTDTGEIQGFNHLTPADNFSVDSSTRQAKAEDYDALVLPGGVANPDALRMDENAVSFIQGFFNANKPVAAICHAPWSLIEAGVVKGRTLTSWPSLKTDIENAGGNWVDKSVCQDQGLITSRKPDDLDDFCSTMLEAFAA